MVLVGLGGAMALLNDRHGGHGDTFGVVQLILLGCCGVAVVLVDRARRRQRQRDVLALEEISTSWLREDDPIADILAERIGDPEPCTSQFAQIDTSWPTNILRDLVTNCTRSVKILDDWRQIARRAGTPDAIASVEWLSDYRRALLTAASAALAQAELHEAEHERAQRDRVEAERVERERQQQRDEADIQRLMDDIRRERGAQ